MALAGKIVRIYTKGNFTTVHPTVGDEIFHVLGGATGNVRESPKPVGCVVWQPWMSVRAFVPIHALDVELFP